MPHHVASANPMNWRGRDLLATLAMSFLKVLEIYKYKKLFLNYMAMAALVARPL
jgi:hypothetical protein